MSLGVTKLHLFINIHSTPQACWYSFLPTTCNRKLCRVSKFSCPALDSIIHCMAIIKFCCICPLTAMTNNIRTWNTAISSFSLIMWKGLNQIIERSSGSCATKIPIFYKFMRGLLSWIFSMSETGEWTMIWYSPSSTLSFMHYPMDRRNVKLCINIWNKWFYGYLTYGSHPVSTRKESIAIDIPCQKQELWYRKHLSLLHVQ